MNQQILNKSWHFCILILFLILAISSMSSCSSTKEIKDGQTAYQMKLYLLAAELLQKDLGKAKAIYDKKALLLQIAQSYERANETEAAEKYYERALDLGFDPEVQLTYGRILKRNEKYAEAKRVFETYIKEEPYGNTEARNELNAVNRALKWQNQRTNIKVEALEDINSRFSDFAPMLYKKNSLVFTSSRSEATGEKIYGWTGEKFGDLFVSDKQGQSFNSPASFSTIINSPYYEGTAAFSKDFKQLYFSYCPQVSEKATTFCQIYSSEWNAGDWSTPEAVPLFEDTCNIGHPFLTRDGKTLWFSSDFDGGFGGKDLYYSKKTKDGWSEPYNAGRKINTWNDEMFPFIDAEGTLYFASNGHTGMGGLDIFSAQNIRNVWRNVKNLQYPINSGADDFAYIVEKLVPEKADDPILASGYFSSTRSGGKGGDDIYRYSYENINYFKLVGRVIEKSYANPENPDSKFLGMIPSDFSDIKLTFVKNGKEKGAVTTDATGKFEFSLDPNTDYKIFASKPGYFNNAEVFTTKGKGTPDSLEVSIRIEIELERIFPEREIVISNIYYDFNKATLRDESLPILDSLMTLFYENPDIVIELGSHTDSRGTSQYNDDLSQERAQSVVNYMLANGVTKKQLVPKGYGERNLVNKCADGVECTEAEHQENRRTTFRVISKTLDIRSVQPKNIKVDPKVEGNGAIENLPDDTPKPEQKKENE